MATQTIANLDDLGARARKHGFAVQRRDGQFPFQLVGPRVTAEGLAELVDLIDDPHAHLNDMEPREFAEDIFTKLEDQPAQIASDELDEIESVFGAHGDSGDESLGVSRRTALVTLTISGRKLIESIRSDRQSAVAFAAVALCAANYADKLRRLAGLIERAETRIRVALCWRDDMAEVLAEAEGEYESRH